MEVNFRNCLFRALGDQLEGNMRNHLRHREVTVAYMREHRSQFEPFLEDSVSYEHYSKFLKLL